MKITALIAELERVRAEFGDIVVKIPIPETEQYYGGDFEVENVNVNNRSYSGEAPYVWLGT